LGAGYYNEVGKRFHTTISFDISSSGSIAEAAFLGGTDQFVVPGTSNYIPAVLEGKDQVGVLNQEIGLGAVFSAPAKYESSRGTDISKFNSGRWCEIGLSGTSASAVALAAAVNNLDLSKLNVTNIGALASVLPELQNGQCVIVATDANSAAEGILQNISYVPLNAANPAVSIPLVGEDLGFPLTTSTGFINRYPQLAQAIVDATVKSLLFIQQNVNNPTAIYNQLPKAMTSALTLPAFEKSFSFFQQAFTPAYNNGSFTSQMIDDTAYITKATKAIPLDAQVDPSKLADNNLVLQAYKDLGLTPPAGSPTGPETLPTTTGEPTAEAAKAFAILTGQPEPANDGPSKLAGGAGS
jgi:NitT/TauT family transport system substrate-binding protein